MDEHAGEVFSFVFGRGAAEASFPGVGSRDLVLAVLAGMAPEDGWEGALVFVGPSPLDPEATLLVGVEGPGAEPASARLVEAIERLGIAVARVYEGGPETWTPIARADGGRWVAAE